MKATEILTVNSVFSCSIDYTLIIYKGFRKDPSKRVPEMRTQILRERGLVRDGFFVKLKKGDRVKLTGIKGLGGLWISVDDIELV